MNPRDQHGGPPRGPGHFDHPHDRERYASREYEDLPSVTDREWGPALAAGDDALGRAGPGGDGDFPEREPGVAPRSGHDQLGRGFSSSPKTPGTGSPHPGG